MQVHVGRRVAVDRVQELAEVLAPVAMMQLPDHRAGLHVEGREEVARAVAEVVVRAPLGLARRHRQHRRGPLGRLDQRLIVHAQDERPVRRVEVEPDDVTDLLDEQRVLRELECFRAVRLEPEGAPDAADGRLAQVEPRGQPARAPVRRVLGRGFERGGDHLLDMFVSDRSLGSGAGLVGEPVESSGSEAPAPLRHGRRRRAQALGDGRVRRPRLGRGQDNARAEGERLCGLLPTRPPAQRRAVRPREDDGHGKRPRHGSLQYGSAPRPAPPAPNYRPFNDSHH